MSIVIDSNAPYFTEFPLKCAGDAVYMTAEDEILGNVFAIVYRAHRGVPKLSVILFGAHGTSGYVDMTLDRTSRYFGACRGLANAHYKSPVRRALAIAVLRTYATVDKPLKARLRGLCDESTAGALGSRFRLVYGKFPSTIGSRVLDAGLICPKQIGSSIVDIVYEDSDLTIDHNNELVYLLGEQLEQLFDPLSEYSPEPTERLYAPPSSTDVSQSSLENESKEVQDICEELYLLQAHARGDILDLLQTVLIPLRIEVLKGRFPGLTIARLNSVFPPTIDELFRVNNIFYESLRQALPFGAFEVIKACGATIPYFFRACMRHEAATQNIKELYEDLVSDIPDVQEYMSRSADINKVMRIVRNSSHLVAMKELLTRLVNVKTWDSEEQKKQVEEFYSVARGTVDAFTASPSSGDGTKAANPNAAADFDMDDATHGRKLMSAGKILGEITQGWPVELEYGWLNRRVVSVFDGVDVLEPSDALRQLHTVFIIFTDSLVVCRPSEPIPATSLSGLHVPSVGDMLMHAMLNEVPLDKNLPPLTVIAWAPILDVHFASYDKRHLFVFSPGIVGSYKLLEPDSDANNLVTLLAKAKITTKTQPFHLFRINGAKSTFYSTVQELDGYQKETNRTKIALFLSKPINDRILNKYGLDGALSLEMNPKTQTIAVNILSKMRYKNSFDVKKDELQELVSNELAYLMTLSLSSQNPKMLDVILTSNRLVVNRLIQWACQPENDARGHKSRKGIVKTARKTPGSSKALSGPAPPLPQPPKSVAQQLPKAPQQQATQQQAPQAPQASQQPKQVQQPPGNVEEAGEDSHSRILVIPSDSVDSITPINRGLRKIEGQVPPNERDLKKFSEGKEPTEFDRDPSVEMAQSSSEYSSASNSFGQRSDLSLKEEEEEEQRDVDNWYHQLHNSRHDEESLSSELSDTEISFQRSNSNSSSIQIGGFLDNNASSFYNKHSGRTFPRIESEASISKSGSHRFENASYSESHRRQETESSFETIASLQDSVATAEDSFVSGNTTLSNHDEEVEDFSYLASLVDATSFSSKLSELERGGVYPDLRETSLVRLGSYILRNDKSQRDIPNASLDTISEKDGQSEDFMAGEPTPTLHSSKFVAPQSTSHASLASFTTQSKAAAAAAPATASPSKGARPPSKVPSKAYLANPGAYTPFADVELADWHPKVVKSGTTATLSGLLPRVNRYADRFSERNAIPEDLTFTNETDHEIAKRYLAWAESSGRPTSMMSTKTLSEFLNETYTPPESPRGREVPMSKSHLSFRRMVMSSSLHTLQLASFVVQVDQKQLTSSAIAQHDLEEMKDFVSHIYKLQNVSVESEQVFREKLCGYFCLLIKYDCQQLAHGLLEIEWYRRTRINERYPDLAPSLWTF